VALDILVEEPEFRSQKLVKNLFIYLLTVAIWGSTWYAITFQLNGTPTQVSVAYRFALADANSIRLVLAARDTAALLPSEAFPVDDAGVDVVLGQLPLVL
jgi:hypothetical protein